MGLKAATHLVCELVIGILLEVPGSGGNSQCLFSLCGDRTGSLPHRGKRAGVSAGLIWILLLRGTGIWDKSRYMEQMSFSLSCPLHSQVGVTSSKGPVCVSINANSMPSALSVSSKFFPRPFPGTSELFLKGK